MSSSLETFALKCKKQKKTNLKKIKTLHQMIKLEISTLYFKKNQ